MAQHGSSHGGRGSSIQKEAKLGCGLLIKVPLFIRVGDQVKVDTETHKYHGKESAKR
jgi:hypothetical protein